MTHSEPLQQEAPKKAVLVQEGETILMTVYKKGDSQDACAVSFVFHVTSF